MKIRTNTGLYLTTVLSAGVTLGAALACASESAQSQQSPVAAAGAAGTPTGLTPSVVAGSGGAVSVAMAGAGPAAGGDAVGMAGSVAAAGTPPAAGAPGAGGGGMPSVPGVWTLSKTITLDTTSAGADVDEDVDNYPVAVLLTAQNFDFSQAQMTGADIRFFDAEDIPLPHAIEHWDAANQLAAIWVFLDVVNGNDNSQSIVMKWGNPNAEDASDSAAVFNEEAGFLGVYHLSEDGNTDEGGYKDASWNQVHGTGQFLTPGSLRDARIGQGTYLDNQGGGGDDAQWIEVSGPKVDDDFHGAGEHAITATAWAIADSFEGYYETIFSKGDRAWTLQCDYMDRIEACTYVGYHACAIVGGSGFCFDTVGQWIHYMVVHSGNNLEVFMDGERRAGAGGNTQLNDERYAFGIGNQTQYNQDERGWHGTLDEVRVMKGEKSAAWGKLDFESQKQDPTLLSFGETVMISE